jgi:PPM family protein phosphatase
MEFLTIGAFARASRLSPKALRLYDDLGLLRPARVDPVNGYRFYAPAQLERARLVAWLRRLGMPLARIRTVCELAPAAAAEEVAAFWARVEADTAARRDLAAFLVDHLSHPSRRDPTMSGTVTPLGIRYAALCDAGLVRESNQDAAHADSRLLAVADGYGPAGARAGSAAIEALKRVDTGVRAGDLLNVLEDAVRQANRAVHETAAEGAGAPQGTGTGTPHGTGTTLTALLWTGSRLALVHVGDSRAYVLRDGGLFQITHDDTLVQSMVDEGRITPEEAATHPQRSLLLRALSGGEPPTADVRLHDVHPADRYLLCSDGLSSVVPDEDVREVVAAAAGPEQAVRELVALAHRAGAPDNVACVVADVVELTA